MVSLISKAGSRQPVEQHCVSATVSDAIGLARPHRPYRSIDFVLRTRLSLNETTVLTGLEYLRRYVFRDPAQETAARFDIECAVASGRVRQVTYSHLPDYASHRRKGPAA
jgi:hypothetical protein